MNEPYTLYSHSIDYEIALILESSGIGTFATDIFCSKEPNTPDNCVIVYRTGEIPDDVLETTHRSNEIYSFTILVKNIDYLTAWARMEECYANLHKQSKTLIGGNWEKYYKIWSVNTANDLKRDTHNRTIVSADFECLRNITEIINSSSSSSSSSDGISSSSYSSSDQYSESSESESVSNQSESSSSSGVISSESSQSLSSDSSSSSELYSLSSQSEDELSFERL